ncbi:MAG: hypothetical protein ACYDG4_00390 [Desulfuromonadaceae bacterium]
MGKSRHSKSERLPPFVPIFFDELDSTAYRKLSANAAKLLPYFRRVCVKATRGKPDETTLFGFTYTEAVKYGFAKRTFSRAVQELQKHGFIDIAEIGGLRGAGHSCSKYILSKRWVTFGGIEWAKQAERERKKEAQKMA